jgi:hypothetical protein
VRDQLVTCVPELSSSTEPVECMGHAREGRVVRGRGGAALEVFRSTKQPGDMHAEELLSQ